MNDFRDPPTVRDLIELLQHCDQDATVLLAHQPSWPLQFTVHGVWDATVAELPCDLHDDVWCDECPDREPNPYVYIVEGDPPTDTPYAPRQAWAGAVAS